MGIDDALDDGQAQADAAMRAAIDLPVTLENDGQLRRGNSTAGIRNRDLDAAGQGCAVTLIAPPSGVCSSELPIRWLSTCEMRSRSPIQFRKIARDVGDELYADARPARGAKLVDRVVDQWRR